MTLLRADKEKSLLQRRDTKPQVDLIRIIHVTCWMSCLGDTALPTKKSHTPTSNCLKKLLGLYPNIKTKLAALEGYLASSIKTRASAWAISRGTKPLVFDVYEAWFML